MKRLGRLPIWALFLLATGLGCAQKKPENVILIVVDTLRADHLSLYGYDRSTSPRLDEWASRGLVFDRAFATSSWTLPTFGSVLTGLWPAQHAAGARVQDPSKTFRRSPLSPSVATLPEVMRQNGFATGAIVNNAFLRKHFGADRGFDFYDYKKGRRASAVVDLAQSWLSETAQSPFFLMVHMMDPHLPYVPPEEFMGRFGDLPEEVVEPRGRGKILDQLPDLTEMDWASLEARYDEEIASVDHELDRLFRYLEELGLWSSSLVLLISDHGEEFFDHGGFEHGHSMFQEVLRVPLIVWGPGIGGGREDTPVSLVDLVPTIYEATGVVAEQGLPGVSLWGVIRGDGRPERREILAQNTLWGREQEVIISYPYKLILDPESGRRQLFDLVADPLEKRDLAAEESPIAEELERRLQDRLAGLEGDLVEPGADLTRELEEELRALGYLD